MNFLIILLYSNGDCLFATPVAKFLKQKYPGCKVSWAVASGIHKILENNPYIDEIIIHNNIIKNNRGQIRKIVSEYEAQKSQGIWDEVYFLQIADKNQGYFTGNTRNAILAAFPFKIDDITPVIELTNQEIDNAARFIEQHKIKSYSNRIVFEFAPMSGQSTLTIDKAINIARHIIAREKDTCIILSSHIQFTSPDAKIIDGSVLTFRENAELIKACNLILGTSSGISWLSTTSYCQPQIRMIQLVNKGYIFPNYLSVDFKRNNIDSSILIETEDENLANTTADIVVAGIKNFEEAKRKYNINIKVRFNTTPKIVYDAICYGQFRALYRHWKLNIQQYGLNILFIINYFWGFLVSPYFLVRNKIKKLFLK